MARFYITPSSFFQRWKMDKEGGEPQPTTAASVRARVAKTIAAITDVPLGGGVILQTDGRVEGLNLLSREFNLSEGTTRKEHRALLKNAQKRVSKLKEILQEVFARDAQPLESDVADRRMEAKRGRHESSLDAQKRYQRTLDEIAKEIEWRDEAIVQDQRVQWQRAAAERWRSGFQQEAGLGDELTAVAMKSLKFNVNKDVIRKRREREKKPGDKPARK